MEVQPRVGVAQKMPSRVTKGKVALKCLITLPAVTYCPILKWPMDAKYFEKFAAAQV